MYAIEEISMTLRAARKAKGLSQRELAKLAGVPQSHISKIENAGVDLRVSSLSEIARALDLELTLIPRKAVPAVRSIVRSAQPEIPGLSRFALNDDLAKIEKLADTIADQYGAVKEATQLQSRVHDLTRLPIPDSYLSQVRKLIKQLERLKKQRDLNRLVESLANVQALRNEIAHFPSEEVRQVSRSAYSLEEDDG